MFGKIQQEWYSSQQLKNKSKHFMQKYGRSLGKMVKNGYELGRFLAASSFVLVATIAPPKLVVAYWNNLAKQRSEIGFHSELRFLSSIF